MNRSNVVRLSKGKTVELRYLMLLFVCVLLGGCASTPGLLQGRGAEYRAEFEQRKAAVLAAGDAKHEATALREWGIWFRQSPYGYCLRTDSQPKLNGVDLTLLKSGEPVRLQIYMKSDFEPRGDFTFVPKEKLNLLLLEGN